MDNKEFLYKKEYDTLREELNGIRKAQMWFISVSVATTGLLLQMSGKENSHFPFAIACLFPLIVLLPSWQLFFDKAISFHRIVGYLKVLEKIIINPDLAKDFPGWENALVVFRGRQEHKFPRQKKVKADSFSRKTTVYFQKSIRYLSICHRIFAFLSVLCLLLSLYAFFQDAHCADLLQCSKHF